MTNWKLDHFWEPCYHGYQHRMYFWYYLGSMPLPHNDIALSKAYKDFLYLFFIQDALLYCSWYSFMHTMFQHYIPHQSACFPQLLPQGPFHSTLSLDFNKLSSIVFRLQMTLDIVSPFLYFFISYISECSLWMYPFILAVFTLYCNLLFYPHVTNFMTLSFLMTMQYFIV